MKLKNITSILLTGLLLASCAVGPTAFLADGSSVTLGGSLMSKSDADARQANMPNGLGLSWVRTNADETSVPNNAIMAYGVAKVAQHAAASVVAREKTAQVKAVEGTKQLQTTTTGAVDTAAVGTAVPGVSNVTTPNVQVVNPTTAPTVP